MTSPTATPRRSQTGIVTRLLALAIFAAMFVLLPNTTRADSTATYNFSGTLASGGTFSGTLEFDQNGSALQLINTSFALDGNSYACNGASSNNCTVFSPLPFNWFTVQGSTGTLVLLDWLGLGFDMNNPPATFNFLGGYCLGCGFGFDSIASGQASIVGTPEPGSLLLLGAGILGLALLSRRRLNSSPNIA
jgi:PEP-CTERM motif-containing protein